MGKRKKSVESRRALELPLEWLVDPIPAHSLAFVRILWGCILFITVMEYTRNDYAKMNAKLVRYRHNFRYWGFEWLPAPSFFEAKMVMWLMGMCSVFFALGLFFHIAALALFLTFVYCFALEMTNYLNHYYLIIVITFVFVFLPANRCWSLDAVLGRVPRREYVPKWVITTLRLLVCNVYFHAGMAKMNEDWLHGEPLLHWLPSARHALVHSSILRVRSLALIMSWCGLCLDTFLPFALMRGGGSVRRCAFVISVAFHVTNKIIFNIGVFPLAMLVLDTLFLAPHWPLQARALFTVGGSSKGAGAISGSAKTTSARISFPRPRRVSTKHRAVLAVMFVVCCLQLLIPLRHWVCEGDVVWNECGHRFSWRMKLRDKRGFALFYATVPSVDDSSVNTTVVLNVRHFLTQRQAYRVAVDPELIVRTARAIADLWTERMRSSTHTSSSSLSASRPSVRAVVVAQVNFRKAQLLIDPRVDLAASPPQRPFVTELAPRDPSLPSPWVLPPHLEERASEYLANPRLADSFPYGLDDVLELLEARGLRLDPSSQHAWDTLIPPESIPKWKWRHPMLP